MNKPSQKHQAIQRNIIKKYPKCDKPQNANGDCTNHKGDYSDSPFVSTAPPECKCKRCWDTGFYQAYGMVIVCPDCKGKKVDVPNDGTLSVGEVVIWINDDSEIGTITGWSIAQNDATPYGYPS